MLPPAELILSVGICILAYFLFLNVFSSRRAPLSPGPKPWPIVGHVPQRPRVPNWLIFQQWGKLYGRQIWHPKLLRSLTKFFSGDVVYVRIAGHKVVILNSYKAVHDLMIHRFNQYSDRSHRVMGEL